MENSIKNASKKKIYVPIGSLIIVAVLVVAFLIIINIFNKPNEEKAKILIENYVSTMTDGNGIKMIELIDPEGYVIFNEYKEKDFDKNYKRKLDSISEYLNKNSISDINEVKQKISADFENIYGYHTYTVTDVISIENSEKSKNLVIVRCKIQLKSNGYTTVNSAKFYIFKNNGNYKIVGIDM